MSRLRSRLNSRWLHIFIEYSFQLIIIPPFPEAWPLQPVSPHERIECGNVMFPFGIEPLLHPPEPKVESPDNIKLVIGWPVLAAVPAVPVANLPEPLDQDVLVVLPHDRPQNPLVAIPPQPTREELKQTTPGVVGPNEPDPLGGVRSIAEVGTTLGLLFWRRLDLHCRRQELLVSQTRAQEQQPPTEVRVLLELVADRHSRLLLVVLLQLQQRQEVFRRSWFSQRGIRRDCVIERDFDKHVVLECGDWLSLLLNNNLRCLLLFLRFFWVDRNELQILSVESSPCENLCVSIHSSFPCKNQSLRIILFIFKLLSSPL